MLFSLAPLQGITDFAFRNLFNKHFEGINKFYTPFIRLTNDGSIKRNQVIDIHPDNNKNIKLIPQILCNKSSEFIYMAGYLNDLGYDEINWNLGCPFPMIAKRQLGSGLLLFPEKIEQILKETLPNISCKVSIKMRLGYQNNDEIFQILPILNRFPLSEIIIHSRNGNQMYKGMVNEQVFADCLKVYMHEIAYNGDIKDMESFLYMNNKYPDIKHWMIGRSLITNPFLVEEINQGSRIDENKKKERFSDFHYQLYECFCKNLSGPGHIINKMLHYWEYFSKAFSNSHKNFKMIKKSNTINQLENSFYEIFNSEMFIL